MANVSMACLPGSNVETLRTKKASRSRIAGPAAKAEARNRGARIAVNQKGRAARPAYKKAVTVWIETAHGMESRMIGLSHFGGGSSRRSDDSVQWLITILRTR